MLIEDRVDSRTIEDCIFGEVRYYVIYSLLARNDTCKDSLGGLSFCKKRTIGEVCTYSGSKHGIDKKKP